jgi:hypothetical protein
MKTVNIKFGDETEVRVTNEEQPKINEGDTIMDLSFDFGSIFLASLINVSSVVAIRMQNIDYKFKSQLFKSYKSMIL